MTTAILKRLTRIERVIQSEGEWLNQEQVDRIFGLSPKYMQNLRKEGRVRFRSLNGRKFRYNRADIDNLFQ